MLTHLLIQDLVIVDRVELEFSDGMTVFSGETGAGKSILIDALGLALGERADAGLVRSGSEKAEVTASFDIENLSDVQHWLAEQELESEGECILRRTVTSQGRSRGFINGRPAPIGLMQELGGLLIHIHGQHAHQSLMSSDHQRRSLDDFGHHQKPLANTKQSYQDWQQAKRRLDELQQQAQDRETRLELLNYQVEELDVLNLQPGELETLDEEHRRLAHADELRQHCSAAVHQLYESDNGSVTQALGQILADLEHYRDISPALSSSLELLNGALIQAEEATTELRNFADNLEQDPAALADIEERLGHIQDLARKHRVEPAGLCELHEQLHQELKQLSGAGEELEHLQEDVKRLEQVYVDKAEQLRSKRLSSATKVGKQVSREIKQLGMPHGRFSVELESLPIDKAQSHGLDRITFTVQANPGQPPQPLARAASGGELSRISLALQVSMAQTSRVPTLIFDEVDVGIGGGVAEIVGRLLRTVGDQRQVFSVTHLPQVASQAHQHLKVAKKTSKGQTRTLINSLPEEQRITEIARMLGGVEMTENTLAHAKEMLMRA